MDKAAMRNSNFPVGKRFWIAQTLFWLAFWVLETFQVFETRRAYGLEIPALGPVMMKLLIPTVLGLAITTGFWSLFVRMRQVDEKRFIAVAIIACAIGAAFFSAGQYEAKYLMGQYETSQLLNWKRWGPYAPSRFIVLASWTAIFLYLLFSDEAARQRGRLKELETAAAQARSEMLRYQVNPHLLFNALNTVSGHVLNNDMRTADRAIQSLSDLLRISLADGDATSISLEQEIQRVKLYLDVERTRFGERLRTRFDIPPDLAQMRLPPLLLQPLVENAMKHGLARSAEGGVVIVTAAREAGRIAIVVRNEMPEHAVIEAGPGRSDGFGVGLKNVAERLDMFFGGDTSLEIAENTERAFAVRIAFPDAGAAAAS